MPNYLIIILNRGKGNIFNCNVQIPEIFCPSNYVQNEKNKYFKLIGVVSHFGESGMGGHFIAFCKHNIDGKWRCYNDSIVTECQNDYLKKGTPYILFYQKKSNSVKNIEEKNKVNYNLNSCNINNYSNNITNQNNSNEIQINMVNNNFQPNFDIKNNNNIQQNMNMNNYNKMMNINNNIYQNMNFNTGRGRSRSAFPRRRPNG